jgi:hypothetical protein
MLFEPRKKANVMITLTQVSMLRNIKDVTDKAIIVLDDMIRDRKVDPTKLCYLLEQFEECLGRTALVKTWNKDSYWGEK